MKKLMIMAFMVASATASFAQADVIKSILKAKSYDEAASLVKSNEASLSPEEKAKAYNKLVDLSMEKVDKEQQTITANQMAEQMKTGKVEAYDTLGYYKALYNALDAAMLADQFDQMPNEKGKVKPKFHKANQDRLYALRPYLINAGQEAMRKEDANEALKNFKIYVESALSPLFKDAEAAKNKDQYLGEIARVAAVYSYQNKNFADANKYIDIALQDPETKKDAMGLKLYLLQQDLKTKDDSIKYVDNLKKLYAEDKDNEQIFGNLAQMYGSLGMKSEQKAMLDERLSANPNDFMALALRGQEAANNGKDDEAIADFKKALESKKDDSLVLTYLGFAMNRKASNINNNPAEQKKLYEESAKYLEYARDVDPNCERANWKYPLYQAYYSLYGADDSRTKELEAMTKR